MRYKIINLARATQRRAEMEPLINQAGLADKTDFFLAIDGQELRTSTQAESLRHQAQRAPRFVAPPLTWGEVACFLSHRALWHELSQDSKHSHYVILEDDISLDSTLEPIVESLAKTTEPKPDLVRLHAIRPRAERLTPLCALTPQTKLCLSFGPDHKNPIGHWLVGTGGYFLSKQGAQRLLETTAEINAPLDLVLRRHWHHRLLPLVIEPLPLSLREASATSTIDRATATQKDFVLPPIGGNNPRHLKNRLLREAHRTQDRHQVRKLRRHLAKHYGKPSILALPHN